VLVQHRVMAAMVGIGSEILDLGRSRPASIASTGFEFGADPESFGLPNVANVSAHYIQLSTSRMLQFEKLQNRYLCAVLSSSLLSALLQ
jgi:hypothetical protein